MPEDQMEESSYSTYLSRFSRYLAEVISACYAYGLEFEIQGNDNHEGRVYYSANGTARYAPMQDAMTPATISLVVAEALSDALADAMHPDMPNVPIYFVQVVIENGVFKNANTGIRIADNVQQMAQFLRDYPNINIDIVPAYD
jgi:hypothetical protein